jgi:hypothetical protein
VKEIYLGTPVTGTVVTTALDGFPQRVIRTDVVDEIEGVHRHPPAGAAAALQFRKITGTSYRDLITEGLAMKKSQDLTWSQLAMAANADADQGEHGRRQAEVGILPTGQGIGVIDELPTSPSSSTASWPRRGRARPPRRLTPTFGANLSPDMSEKQHRWVTGLRWAKFACVGEGGLVGCPGGQGDRLPRAHLGGER